MRRTYTLMVVARRPSPRFGCSAQRQAVCRRHVVRSFGLDREDYIDDMPNPHQLIMNTHHVEDAEPGIPRLIGAALKRERKRE